jgi:hypothetical protein
MTHSVDAATQPPAPTGPSQVPQHRTHCAHIGTYLYLCRTGASPTYDFTYSHTRFGRVVWHK